MSNGYINRAFLWVHNARRTTSNQNWLHCPLLLGVPNAQHGVHSFKKLLDFAMSVARKMAAAKQPLLSLGTTSGKEC